jgi:hypothetical protein
MVRDGTFHYFSCYQCEKMRKKQLLWLKKFFGRRPVLSDIGISCDWISKSLLDIGSVYMALMTYKLTRLKCLNEGITSKLQKER